jgi:hypothetical protein
VLLAEACVRTIRAPGQPISSTEETLASRRQLGRFSNAVAAAPLERERLLKRSSRSRLGRIAADHLSMNEGPFTPFGVRKRPGRNPAELPWKPLVHPLPRAASLATM